MAALRQAWFVSLIGLAAVLLLVWLLGPYLAIGEFVPFASLGARIGTTVFCVLVWACFVGWLIFRKRRANAGLMRGIADDEAGERAEEDVGQLREQFETAIRTLKETRGKRGGAVSLYDLPWYVIIGPPGAGKTTVLANSGLRFPLASRFGNKAVRGLGGTRNCDWWFTDEAIFLDTAGRYTTHDSNEQADREGWHGFLELLQKYRRRRPINGVLIAISLQDLLTSSPAERQQHVSAIRKRVAELQRFFTLRFPVYVLLTKCDLVPGFTEFFDDLGSEERAQVWGFTLNVEESRTLDNLDALLKDNFAMLVRRLQGRVMRRLNEERDLARRAALFSFPDQVAAALDIVKSFVSDTFSPSSYEQTAFVRGIYLTSGTQEGTPIDRVLGGLARTFGLEAAFSGSGPRQGRSYFITRLLRDVMFEESGLTGVNRRFERQRLWMQRAAWLGVAALTLLAIGAWVTSYSLNRLYLSKVEQTVAAWREAKTADTAADAALAAALPRLEASRAVRETARMYAEDVPFGMGFGLYQGDYLGDAATDAYAREVDGQLLPRLRSALERELLNPQRDVYQVYELLRVYLMLGDTRYFSADDVLAVATLLARGESGADTTAPAALETHLEAGLRGQPRPQPVVPDVVARARQRLAAQPLEVFVLNRIKRDFDKLGEPPLRLLDLIGARGPSLVSRRSGKPLDEPVSALYTRKGYYETFLVKSTERLGTLVDEQWVLGDARGGLEAAELAQLPQKLSALYQAEYVQAWEAMINDVQFARLGGLQDASDKLLLLAGMDSPIRQLLTALERNTSLSELKLASVAGAVPGGAAVAAAAESAGKAASRIGEVLDSGTGPTVAGPLATPGRQIEERFKPLRDFVRGPQGGPGRLDALLATLGQIQQEISATGGGIGEASARDTVLRGDLARRLDLEAQSLPSPVRQWISQLAGDVRRAVVGSAASEVKKEMSAAVAESCAPLIEGRYPFARSAKEDTKLGDFGRVFAQGGLLDAFFGNRLAPLVDTSARPWRWRSADGGGGLGLSPSALAQFERAATIRSTWFAGGTPQPKFQFDVVPVRLTPNIAQVLLTIDGQSVTYRHGPVQAQRLEWPGPAGGQVRVVFTSHDGHQQSHAVEGPWALFRFLDEVGRPGAAPDRVRAVIGGPAAQAEFEFVSNSALNPFNTALLADFRCPGGV